MAPVAASAALAAASLAASAAALAASIVAPAAPLAAAEASAAAEAAVSTAEAAAAETSAMAGAAAEAAASTAGATSSFLPQAERATAANRVASTSDLFMFILSRKVDKKGYGPESSPERQTQNSETKGQQTLSQQPSSICRERKLTHKPSVLDGNASTERCISTSSRSRARTASAGSVEIEPRQRSRSIRRSVKQPGASSKPGSGLACDSSGDRQCTTCDRCRRQCTQRGCNL
jgi:hypothetical protein